MRILWQVMRCFYPITLGVLVSTIILVVFSLSGCNEAQQQWGQGDPPLGWQKDFGNSNIARLDFVQTQMLNKHANELVQLVDRIKKLEEAQDAPAKIPRKK